MNLKELIKEVESAKGYGNTMALSWIKVTVEAVDNTFRLDRVRSPTYNILDWQKLKKLLGIN
ncbi:hypothetical protein LCGC14_2522290 [marine sediment metagenome]|uniref:Uncharacterized protein n=1 Tax=marine sediment metagenome TaxID=412755 RepID=A0A0F9DPE4_9ZZZZ